MRDVRMPWGKHKSELLTEIDSSYLAWVVESADHVAPSLALAILAELRRRFGEPPPSASRRHACPDPRLAVEIVSVGVRSLAKRHHPDHGGDTRTMQTINAVGDWLKGLLS